MLGHLVDLLLGPAARAAEVVLDDDTRLVLPPALLATAKDGDLAVASASCERRSAARQGDHPNEPRIETRPRASPALL